MAVLKEPEMRREILNGIPDDEKEAVKVFVDHNKESALKVKPKVSANQPCCFNTHDRIFFCRIHSKLSIIPHPYYHEARRRRISIGSVSFGARVRRQDLCRWSTCWL